MSSVMDVGRKEVGGLRVEGWVVAEAQLLQTCSRNLRLSSPSVGNSPDLQIRASGLVLALPARYTILGTNAGVWVLPFPFSYLCCLCCLCGIWLAAST